MTDSLDIHAPSASGFQVFRLSARDAAGSHPPDSSLRASRPLRRVGPKIRSASVTSLTDSPRSHCQRIRVTLSNPTSTHAIHRHPARLAYWPKSSKSCPVNSNLRFLHKDYLFSHPPFSLSGPGWPNSVRTLIKTEESHRPFASCQRRVDHAKPCSEHAIEVRNG